jgi:alpha-1,6-mannosyltransferase
MHIADATLFFAPRSGGVRRYLECKRRYLTSLRGVRHTLVVPGPADAIREGHVEISAPRIPFAGGYRLPMHPALWRDALRRAEPDLIEVGDPYHLAWAALAAAEDLDVPAVAFAHSHLSRLLKSRFGKVAGWAADTYLHHLYSRFDVVLAPSESVASDLRSHGIERVEVQRLGVEAEVFHPRERDPDLRSLLGLPAATRLLAFAGRMAREKSVPLLCETVESLGAPYHLLLIGGRERRRVSARVTELPYQRNAQRLARLLASADAFLHAGQQETFGLVIVEAMACGRPVVGVRAGAVAELIDDSIGRLAQTGTVESLRSAVLSVFQNDPEVLGLAARARVERAYTWNRVFDALVARYARLAKVHSSGLPTLAEQAP